MSASMFDQWPQSGQTFLEPMLELNNITVRLYGDVAREQLKAANELILCHAEQLQQLSHVKRMEDIMAIQAGYIAKASAPIYELAQHMLNSTLESASIYSKWMEKSYYKAEHTAEKAQSQVHNQMQKMQPTEKHKHERR